MSNSSLISYTRKSPNYTSGRTHRIDRITPHYMDGNLSIESCGDLFAAPARRASSNYAIGSDGRIALYVDEANRAWTSGSSYNDNRAVTIECANLSDGSLTEKCWNSLVALCADICKRNGIARMNYTGNDKGNLTMHKWYQDTDCPGPWLSKNFARLADEVNAVLSGKESPSVTVTKNFGGLYICRVADLCIRTQPTIKAPKLEQHYHYGETVWLDNWYTIADGYVWGTYTGLKSGEPRFIAVGRATGKVESDDYLVKIS